MTKRFVALVAIAITALTLVAGLAGSATAQDTSATPESMGLSHPAHIHAGTCPDVGDVVFPLENVTAADAATPAAIGAMATPDMAGATLTSTTTVEASLDDILAAEHAINVHKSNEEIDVYIACGDLTGEPTDGELVVQLEEVNGSGDSGQATLTDNGDGTTTVVIELTHGGMGTPEATPAA